jgi:hypothetical protein
MKVSCLGLFKNIILPYYFPGRTERNYEYLTSVSVTINPPGIQSECHPNATAKQTCLLELCPQEPPGSTTLFPSLAFTDYQFTHIRRFEVIVITTQSGPEVQAVELLCSTASSSCRHNYPGLPARLDKPHHI